MYYRRKLVLALLQAFGGELEKLSLQKLLFLLTRQQEKKSFDFVPYKYGCFSFQANADLNTLTKYELVSQKDKSWVCLDKTNYFETLKPKDKAATLNTKKNYGSLTAKELITLTYQQYPYFAIKSTIAKDILNKKEFKRVEAQKRKKTETILYTIGYEGISLETYINKLILNDVRVLCDVRKNSFSMKYGFSKSQLKNACQGVGIKFYHIPEVGIKSEKRKELTCQTDYDLLFEDYKETVLAKEKQKQVQILELLKKEKRIALTCFEKNIHQCHRKHLANSIKNFEGFNYEIKHI